MAAPARPIFRLRCLSFNTWFVPLVGVRTEERLEALIQSLADGPEYDVIAFQEVFIPLAVSRLREALPGIGLPHVVHFCDGAEMPANAAGSGCMIASRFPILDTAWHSFGRSGGKPWRIDEWDWQAGKGVGLARILLPGAYGTADVYISHLQAQYADAPHDEYEPTRVLQALEAAVFIRTTRRSDLTLFLADLNSGPDTQAYRVISTLAGLRDAYSCTHTREEEITSGTTLTKTRAAAEMMKSPASSALQATRAVARSIYDSTFGSERNTFSKLFGGLSSGGSGGDQKPAGAASGSASAGDDASSPTGTTGGLFCSSRPPSCDVNARLDYILFGTGTTSWPFTVSHATSTLLHRAWFVLNSDIRMTEYVTLKGGRTVNLSDHSAVYAELGCVVIERTDMHPHHPVTAAVTAAAAADAEAERTRAVEVQQQKQQQGRRASAAGASPLLGGMPAPLLADAAALSALPRGSSSATSPKDSTPAGAVSALPLSPLAAAAADAAAAASADSSSGLRISTADESPASAASATAPVASAVTDASATPAVPPPLSTRSAPVSTVNADRAPLSTRSDTAALLATSSSFSLSAFGDDGTSGGGGGGGVEDAELLLREAMKAAGVPLHRLAPLPPEMRRPWRSRASDDAAESSGSAHSSVGAPRSPALSNRKHRLSGNFSGSGSASPLSSGRARSADSAAGKGRSLAAVSDAAASSADASTAGKQHWDDVDRSMSGKTSRDTGTGMTASRSSDGAARKAKSGWGGHLVDPFVYLGQYWQQIMVQTPSASRPVSGVPAGAGGAAVAQPSGEIASAAAFNTSMLASAADDAVAGDSRDDFTSPSAWRPVLFDCLAELEKGLGMTEGMRRRQVKTAVGCFMVVPLLLAIAHGRLSSPMQAIWAIVHATAFAAGCLAAFLSMLRLDTFAVALAALVTLSLTGIVATTLLLIHQGTGAGLMSLACGIIVIGVLNAWTSFTHSAPEVLAFKRAITQVQILLVRPPAVIA